MYWERIKKIEEEYEELKRKIAEMEEKLRDLPKGHLEAKKLGNNVYYYLRYWEDGRLKSKYLGKDAGEVLQKLREAEDLKKSLNSLKIKIKEYEIILEKLDRIINSKPLS
jgi:cell division septum initiation protein DivIVA